MATEYEKMIAGQLYVLANFNTHLTQNEMAKEEVL